MRAPYLLVSLLAAACANGASQHARALAASPACSGIRVSDDDREFNAPHRELRTIFVRCRAASACEEALVARACELGADAVWLKKKSYLGTKGHAELSEEGLAVAFVK